MKESLKKSILETITEGNNYKVALPNEEKADITYPT